MVAMSPTIRHRQPLGVEAWPSSECCDVETRHDLIGHLLQDVIGQFDAGPGPAGGSGSLVRSGSVDDLDRRPVLGCELGGRVGERDPPLLGVELGHGGVPG